MVRSANISTVVLVSLYTPPEDCVCESAFHQHHHNYYYYYYYYHHHHHPTRSDHNGSRPTRVVCVSEFRDPTSPDATRPDDCLCWVTFTADVDADEDVNRHVATRT